MSTISNKILNILRNPLHVGQFHAAENAADFFKIKVADLDLLAENVATARTYLLEVRQEQQEKTRKKLEAFLSTNADLGISSVEDLLKQLTGGVEAPVVQAKAKTKADNNTKFEVTLFNPETEKHETFVVVNKVLSKKLREHPVYVAAVKKDKSLQDIDNFLRAYSPQYAEKYPINAKWKTKEFHINDSGKLNKQSQIFFNEHRKTVDDATTDEFRTLVKENYKKV